MEKKDYADFATAWETAREVLNKSAKFEPLSNRAMIAIFNTFIEFPLELVRKGLSRVVATSEFMPSPAQVVNVIKEIYGEDEASLQLKADTWYSKLNKDFSMGHDIITDDRRAVVAFKQCFKDMREFGSHPLSADPFDRKAFVKAYMQVKDCWIRDGKNTEDDFEQLNHIRGIYSYEERMSVRFIGDLEKCKQIAKTVYLNKRPRYITLIALQEHEQLTRIAQERSQRALLTMNGTDVPKEETNQSMNEYVSKEENLKNLQEVMLILSHH